MDIFLLAVKDSTRKQTQSQKQGSQVGTGSTMQWRSYIHFVPSVQTGVSNEALNI